jgi:lipopolysaccharide export system protein LptC
MRRPDLHSRLVRWLKILLPLVALALLSTLFVVSGRIDPDAAIPFAEVDVNDRIREPRMTAPDFAGITSDGGALEVTAAEAVPGAAVAQGREDPEARLVAARLTPPDGAAMDLAAREVVVDRAAGLIRLAGDVEMLAAAGYRIESEAVDLQSDRTGLVSPGPVFGEGPPGTLWSNTMALTRDPAAPDDFVLLFTGGVKLIYLPAK